MENGKLSLKPIPAPTTIKYTLQELSYSHRSAKIPPSGMDFEAFRSDIKTVKAVELDLIVIGEAANQIPDCIQEENPQIPWTLICAMRNRLVHVFFSVDASLLWDTVQKDLPTLKSALKLLLG